MTRIKLCGIMREEDIKVINEILPNYIGFVFAEKSKRFISYDRAKKLKESLEPKVKAAGVFVNEDIKNIIYLVKNKVIDIIQLHGNEDRTYINTLKEEVNIPIIRAYRIKSRFDVGAGCGEIFDETLLEDFNEEYFLAGGLSPDNIKEKIMRLHPFAVDVSSGIETDGKKDAFKMRKFVSLVREVENDR